MPIGDPSPSYYQAIHHHLFQDVYHWAGTFRTVRLSKGSSVFCYPENIDAQLRKLFEWLRQEKDLQDIAADEFAQKAAHLLSELNVIHPFREGNGRTQMVFLGLIAERSGHPLDLDTLNPDEFLQAMITAFRGSEAPLTEAIRRMV